MLVHQRTPWAPLRCSLLRLKASFSLNRSRTAARRRGLCGTTRLLFNCTSQVSQSSPSAPRISSLAASPLPALSPVSHSRHGFATSSRAGQQHDGKDEAPAPNSASPCSTLLGLIDEIEGLKRAKTEPSSPPSLNHECVSTETNGSAVDAAAENAERDKTSASSKRASKFVSKMRLRRHLNARREIGAKSHSKVAQPPSRLPVNTTTPKYAMTDATRIQQLEKLTGHSFNDPTYVKLAATNMDVEIDDQILKKTQDHLAIIGDAAYKLCFYVDRFPSFATATTSREYGKIARNAHMARVAVRTRLGVLMKHLGPDSLVTIPYGEHKLATVFEATLGAIYLDSELNLGAVKTAVNSMKAWSSVGASAVQNVGDREGKSDVVQNAVAKEEHPAVHGAVEKTTPGVDTSSPLLPDSSSARSLNDLRSSLGQAIASKDTTLDSSVNEPDKLKAKAESSASLSTLKRRARYKRAHERDRLARLQLEREQEQLESLGLTKRHAAVTESPSLPGTVLDRNPKGSRSSLGASITDKSASSPPAETGAEESKAHSSLGAAIADKTTATTSAETGAPESKAKKRRNPNRRQRRAIRRAKLLEFQREQDRLASLGLMEEVRRRAELQFKRTQDQLESAGRMRRPLLASSETEEEESKVKVEVEAHSSLGAIAVAEKNKTPPSAETGAPESKAKKNKNPSQRRSRQRRSDRRRAEAEFERARKRLESLRIEHEEFSRRHAQRFGLDPGASGQKAGEAMSIPPMEQKGTSYAMFHV